MRNGTQVPISDVEAFVSGTKGWRNILVCGACGRTGDYWDLNKEGTCRECGSKARIQHVGRWHAPIVPSLLWRFAHFIGLTEREPESKPGYWELK